MSTTAAGIAAENIKAPRAALQDVSHALQQALTGLRFGTVELTVHEGRVVQIERRERWRYTPGGERGERR